MVLFYFQCVVASAPLDGGICYWLLRKENMFCCNLHLPELAPQAPGSQSHALFISATVMVVASWAWEAAVIPFVH